MSLENFDVILSFAAIMLLLSIQVTALVQAVISVLGLRGWNLYFGLEQLFQQLDPNFKLGASAQKLARAVLEHPSLAHTRGIIGRRMSHTIRPQELLRVLDDLGNNPSAGLDATIRPVIQAALLKTSPGEAPEMAEKAAAVVKRLSNIFPNQATTVESAVRGALGETRQLEAELSVWFDTIMDRTIDRFILWSRWITVLLAFVLAFALSIDSIHIFQQLRQNSVIRGRIVEGASTTLAEAEKALSNLKGAAPISTLALRALQEEWKKKDLPEGKKLAGENIPETLVSREQGELWIAKVYADDATLNKVLDAFDAKYNALVFKRLEELKVSFGTIQHKLEDSGVELFNGPPLLGGASFWNPLLGRLLTAIFLSLGAPFWYNALKQLASLRPALAGKVEKEAMQDGGATT